MIIKEAIKMKNNFDIKTKKIIENTQLKEIKIGYSDTKVYTFTKENKQYFLKIGKPGTLTKEYNKLKEISKYIKTPQIVLYEKNKYEQLITTKIKGNMVCSKYYLKKPTGAIDIIVEAFKELYSVNINKIKIDESLNHKLSIAKYNIENNLITDDNLSEEVKRKFKTRENILKYLEENKWEEDLVLSHGDISLPNIFSYKSKFTGFIDLGDLGIADRWFDIAIVIRSINFNFGEEYSKLFLKKLNIEFDEFKYNYFMLLMELYL